MVTTKRFFFSAMFLVSLTLVLGGFVGCATDSPAESGGNQLAPVNPAGVPDITSAAIKAAELAFPDAVSITVTGVEAEEEDGSTIYEVEMLVDGVEVEAEVTADGVVLEIEEDDDDDDHEHEHEFDGDDDDDDDDDDDENEHEFDGEEEGEH